MMIENKTDRVVCEVVGWVVKKGNFDVASRQPLKVQPHYARSRPN